MTNRPAVHCLWWPVHVTLFHSLRQPSHFHFLLRGLWTAMRELLAWESNPDTVVRWRHSGAGGRHAEVGARHADVGKHHAESSSTRDRNYSSWHAQDVRFTSLLGLIDGQCFRLFEHVMSCIILSHDYKIAMDLHLFVNFQRISMPWSTICWMTSWRYIKSCARFSILTHWCCWALCC